MSMLEVVDPDPREQALTALANALASCWLLMDRLDETHQGLVRDEIRKLEQVFEVLVNIGY